MDRMLSTGAKRPLTTPWRSPTRVVSSEVTRLPAGRVLMTLKAREVTGLAMVPTAVKTDWISGFRVLTTSVYSG